MKGFEIILSKYLVFLDKITCLQTFKKIRCALSHKEDKSVYCSHVVFILYSSKGLSKDLSTCRLFSIHNHRKQ